MKTATPHRGSQIAYAAGILVLFSLMWPYKEWLDGVKARKELGEATIGQVDTGSFMLKLALLGGARGVAANVLWTRAIDLQRAHEWDKLRATVDLITKLQPHFLSIWTFQGWNLAYNVSVEWDAPEDKYQWIKEGIKFLREGVRKNEGSPDLVWDTAWTYYHKIGFADEAIILRKLFLDDPDEDFKVSPLDGYPKDDNFLLGHAWFTRAVDLADEGNERLASGLEAPVEYVDKPTQRRGRPGDIAFRSMPAHALSRYAERLEKASIKGVEATFGGKASEAWRRAFDAWVAFGSHPYKAGNTTWAEGKAMEYVKIDDHTVEERFEALSPNAAYWTKRFARQANYPYWKDRSAAEMTVDGVKGRQSFYRGNRAYRAADFRTAVAEYRDGLERWERLLAEHQAYRDDEMNQLDTGLILIHYEKALKQLGKELPEEFPLKDIYEKTRGKEMNLDPFDADAMLGTPAPPPPPKAP